MLFRRSRIRPVVIRLCIISLIIVLFLQFSAVFNNNDNIPKSKFDELLTIEELFWQKLSNKDKTLTNEQRITQIELIDQQMRKKDFNWTKIFFDSYRRKLLKINERDVKTIHKYRFRNNEKNISQEKFKIFEETLVFDRPKFCSSKRIFHPQCPYKNCQWSCDKPSINNKTLRRASIFHHIDIKQDEMREKLQHRSYNDIWILWIDEANRQIENLNQYQFNWTLSFRQDSEVSIGTYGILIEKDEKQILSNDSLYNNLELLEILKNHHIEVTNMPLENRIFLNYRYRHKHALWFVSNCQPQRRLKYYNELKKLYSINGFGLCVKNKCDKNDNCEHKQSHLALFYLAFESQTCTDYITEKFWRALYYGMIPIVLGPSKQSYLDLGVPHTAFIHVDDFQTVDELANHLQQIANDYIIYRKYFQWLNQYEVFYDINDLEPIRMCELCMRLNMQEFQDHSFYTNIHEWHRNAC
ncbi:unnamed protein product [Rotaria sp. Silwood2]|nr:unnamed protein product [Rotaria sp. Silwood2]CAF3243748.1 unnamed protein product [Rotaria sp. Silwood2]CAF4089575.1 unnamed protein product [Rotaria sp. Silwood2]